jgi:hypothetical protein
MVLIGLASCADANHCAFPSVAWLTEFSCLDRKTVIAALARLAAEGAELIADTGLRKGRTKQVKVYQLAAARSDFCSSDPTSASVPESGGSQSRNSSIFSSKASQIWDTEPFFEPNPPSSLRDDTPKVALPLPSMAKTKLDRQPQHSTCQLLSNWKLPQIESLPPNVRSFVQQWPTGGYELVGERFRLHWLSTTHRRRKRDWQAAFAKWLLEDHAKMMRSAKDGISYAPAPKAVASYKTNSPLVAKQKENEASEAVHKELNRMLGNKTYEHWFADLAILVDGSSTKIVCRSTFTLDYVQTEFQHCIERAARHVTGREKIEVQFQIDEPRVRQMPSSNDQRLRIEA